MNSSTAAVVLTYPGHFFQTDLTIKSIKLQYVRMGSFGVFPAGNTGPATALELRIW